ncbi:unnamed protein product [Tilletia controversa]|uniref:Uncharacterized protein n=1 Tax=Tilletia laevis TaxID=157183 RepID=A0A9N8LE19_9BASI|nr:unnamed protein product [Tilletia controversa]CAD6905654.1 unnamed protein product [Tilletia laevis]CAD6926005.1 unnamed protein product [Tilletia laevis]CAD6968694.1 unnamed protein product [Tilletia controversa]
MVNITIVLLFASVYVPAVLSAALPISGNAFNLVSEAGKSVFAMCTLFVFMNTAKGKYEKMAAQKSQQPAQSFQQPAQGFQQPAQGFQQPAQVSQQPRSIFDGDRPPDTPHIGDASDFLHGNKNHALYALVHLPIASSAESPLSERALSPGSAKELVAMFKGVQLAAAAAVIPLAVWVGQH